MIRAYKYLFYRLCKYASIVESKHYADGGIPHLVAFFSIYILVFFNLMTVFVLFNQVVKLDITFSRSTAIIISAAFMFLNYLFFLKGGRYKEFAKLFNNRNDKDQKANTIAFWAYIILTFVLFFTVLPMFAPPR